MAARARVAHRAPCGSCGLSKRHLFNSAAPSLSDAFIAEDFAFNGAFLSGAITVSNRSW